MLPDKTTTIGDGELEKMERVFHSMKAVLRTSAKLRTCKAVCRGWWRKGGREESIVPVAVGRTLMVLRLWEVERSLIGKAGLFVFIVDLQTTAMTDDLLML